MYKKSNGEWVLVTPNELVSELTQSGDNVSLKLFSNNVIYGKSEEVISLNEFLTELNDKDSYLDIIFDKTAEHPYDVTFFAGNAVTSKGVLIKDTGVFSDEKNKYHYKFYIFNSAHYTDGWLTYERLGSYYQSNYIPMHINLKWSQLFDEEGNPRAQAKSDVLTIRNFFLSIDSENETEVEEQKYYYIFGKSKNSESTVVCAYFYREESGFIQGAAGFDCPFCADAVGNLYVRAGFESQDGLLILSSLLPDLFKSNPTMQWKTAEELGVEVPDNIWNYGGAL